VLGLLFFNLLLFSVRFDGAKQLLKRLPAESDDNNNTQEPQMQAVTKK
jgi:hypothetical protein